MLFNTSDFAFFFAGVFVLALLLPHRLQNRMLLVGSYFFYAAWDWRFTSLLAISTLVDYCVGRALGGESDSRRRRLLVTTSIVVNLGILGYFKYAGFFAESLRELFASLGVELPDFAVSVVLPVGISFYTFQTLSYSIEVYMGRQKAERHPGHFALYVAFFPQLVAGPIERSVNLLPQFKKEHKLKYSNVRDGIVFMLWGYFKKVVIADRLSEYVNIVYNNPVSHSGWQNVIATLFFTFQIYCDFSGYSDIAIGTAKIMGIDLMTNFRRPYFALNIREFWQRWHISLSTWFKDYFYIPLGGNRVPGLRRYFNLFATFVVSGLWHGANWTFVIWGALHGFYMIFAIRTKKIREKINQFTGLAQRPGLLKLWQTATTFVLVYFAWIFFRANSLKEAILFIGKIFTPTTGPVNLFRYKADFSLAFILIIMLVFAELLIEKAKLQIRLMNTSRTVKWALLIVTILTIFILGKWESIDFLYFQF